MVKTQMHHLSSATRNSLGKHSEKHAVPPLAHEKHGNGESAGPSVLLMWAYFLGLASIAVVVIGGHFPWFTLAPAIVLLMVTHFRRIDAKYQRKSSSPLLKT